MGILLLPRTSSPDQVVKPEDLPRPGAVGIDEFNGYLFTRRTDGSVRRTQLEGGDEHGNILWNMFADEGRFCNIHTFYSASEGFVPPDYFTPYNGAVFSDGGGFYYNSQTFGGTRPPLEPDVAALVEKLVPEGGYRRFNNEFHVMKIVAGDGTLSPAPIGDQSHYLLFTVPPVSVPARATWGLNIRVVSGQAHIRDAGRADIYADGVKQDGHVKIMPDNGWQQIVQVRNDTAWFPYDTSLFRVYAAPGSVLLVSHPFLFPGRFVPQPGQLLWQVPSFYSWQKESSAGAVGSGQTSMVLSDELPMQSGVFRLDFAHGLGTRPARYWAELVCKTPQAGFTAGQGVDAASCEFPNGIGKIVLAGSEQLVSAIFPAGAALAHTVTSSSRGVETLTQSWVTLTPANWMVRLGAQAI